MAVPAENADERNLIASLRRKDRHAFSVLVSRYHAGLIRVAGAFVKTRATAEEVAQDTWLAVIEGIDRFEGRSSLKSWIFAILANRARTRAVRDGRTINFSDFVDPQAGPSPDLGDSFAASGSWKSRPEAWEELDPERIVSGKELWRHALAMIDALPEGQRVVLTLHDIEGCESDEICAMLGLSESNQRVLLHRARSSLRKSFDRLIRVQVSTDRRDSDN